MKVEWTLPVPGAMREHLVKLEFDFDLGTPARIIGPAGGLSVSEYDCGEGGSATVLAAWMVIERDGKVVKERPIRGRMLKRLREDEDLAERLYQTAVDHIPYE